MKKIKLNYNGLKEVVRESVDAVLKDYSNIHHHVNFLNPVTRLMKHDLHEGLIKTYPLNKTIQYIKEYFKLSDKEIYPIDATNGREQIAIIVPIIGNNLELVKKAFALCGYYLGYPKEDELEDGKIYELQFEKKYEENILEKLRKNEKVIYHVTPIYNVGKIKKIGLTPKSKNSVFWYPERIYFVVGSVKSIVNDVATALDSVSTNKINNGKYAVIEVGLDKIPEHVKFYIDANAPYSIYTYDNISPNAITDIHEIDINNK